MRKSGCIKQKLRARARLKNGGILLFQRFLKMGASTADCIRQRTESIPELHERRTNMKFRLLGKSGLRGSEAALGTMTVGDEWGWGSTRMLQEFTAVERLPVTVTEADLLRDISLQHGYIAGLGRDVSKALGQIHLLVNES